MKRLVTLATMAAMLSFSLAAPAHAGGKGKTNNHASQYSSSQSSVSQFSGSQFQSPVKLKPTQHAAWQGQSASPSQSYQGTWSGQQAGQSLKKPSHPAQQSSLSGVPQFGFESTFGWRGGTLGEQVTHVQFGGPASRLGLEVGDAIIGVNGQVLQTANCWHNTLHRAAQQDGWVTLKIVDGRTGKMAYRTSNLLQLNVR